jgi:hypothetical protein
MDHGIKIDFGKNLASAILQTILSIDENEKEN